MRESCAERQNLVTRYFDLYGKVIIHWYDKQKKEKIQESREWRERGEAKGEIEG